MPCLNKFYSRIFLPKNYLSLLDRFLSSSGSNLSHVVYPYTANALLNCPDVTRFPGLKIGGMRWLELNWVSMFALWFVDFERRQIIAFFMLNVMKEIASVFETLFDHIFE